MPPPRFTILNSRRSVRVSGVSAASATCPREYRSSSTQAFQNHPSGTSTSVAMHLPCKATHMPPPRFTILNSRRSVRVSGVSAASATCPREYRSSSTQAFPNHPSGTSTSVAMHLPCKATHMPPPRFTILNSRRSVRVSGVSAASATRPREYRSSSTQAFPNHPSGTSTSVAMHRPCKATHMPPPRFTILNSRRSVRVSGVSAASATRPREYRSSSTQAFPNHPSGTSTSVAMHLPCKATHMPPPRFTILNSRRSVRVSGVSAASATRPREYRYGRSLGGGVAVQLCR